MSAAVQRRIKRILRDKKNAEEEAQNLQNTVAGLTQRLEKIKRANTIITKGRCL